MFFFLAFHPSVSTNTQTNDFYKLQTDIPRDSDMVENFTCTQTMIQRYKLSLLRPSIKPLSASQKVSVRTDERGFLCLQFMIKTEDNHICFVEFFVSIIIIMWVFVNGLSFIVICMVLISWYKKNMWYFFSWYIYVTAVIPLMILECVFDILWLSVYQSYR